MRKSRIWNGKIKTAFLALLSTALCFVSSCADADGLHDQNALMVTFEFSGLGDDVGGSYIVTGDYDSWGLPESGAVTLSKGCGKTNQIAVSSANIVFTVCDANWKRGWYPALEGNSYDGGDAKWHNFYINDLDLEAGEATIVVSSDNLDSNGRIEPKVSY